VTALVRSELLKQRSTRTVLGLLGAMVGLVLLAVLLHSFGLPADSLGDASRQLMILGRGEFLGVLFAALLGALSVTSEIRHGTIRPTFLVTPRRGRVVAAKVSVGIMLGAAFGAVAGAAAFDARGIDLRLDGWDYGLLVAGAVVAAALWAAIGVGIGALVRSQVLTLVGICAWLLFVEGLLADATGYLGDVGRFLPGSAAAGLSGQGPDTLLSPGAGLALLVGYAIALPLAGAYAMLRRDVE
jgi:ABC-2 type transport system permease protein